MEKGEGCEGFKLGGQVMRRLGGKQNRVKQYDKKKEGWGDPSAIRKTGWGEGLMRGGAEGG